MGIKLTGILIAEGEDIELARALLPEHVRLSRQETGCVRFDLTESETTPGLWQLEEEFTDREAFEAHQKRTQNSEWGKRSAGMKRNFQITEI